MALDKNGDGKLGADELPERMRGVLARADTNKDGYVDKDELTKLAQQQAGRRQGPGPGRGGLAHAKPGMVPTPNRERTRGAGHSLSLFTAFLRPPIRTPKEPQNNVDSCFACAPAWPVCCCAPWPPGRRRAARTLNTGTKTSWARHWSCAFGPAPRTERGRQRHAVSPRSIALPPSLAATTRPANSAAGKRPSANRSKVSPELFELLRASDRWREQSGGAFDPRVQALTELWSRCAPARSTADRRRAGQGQGTDGRAGVAA